MKHIFRVFGYLWAIALMLGFTPVQAQTLTPPKTLVLYDAPAGTEYEKLGLAYAIMLKNLLGHFNAQTDMVPVHTYTAGKMNGYDATFYLGSYYDNTLPPAFLSDAATTQKKMVWFKYNIWALAWNSMYNFQATRGFGFHGLRGMNAIPTSSNPTPGFFNTVNYKGKGFVKYYTFDSAANAINADPDVGITGITDPAKATAAVTVTNPKTGEVAPYVVRSGNFWYFADVPMSYIGPRDRYLVLADMLYDILGVPAPVGHKALVRLEDVGALVTVQSMQTLSDYLHSKRIPFSVAAIPQYVDALGAYNGGVPQSIPLSQASNLKRALDYAVSRGGEIVMHGYTHQYSNMKNPHTGVSGDDYEFWNIVDNTPVAEDSFDYAANRMKQGLADLRSNGYNPVAWEAPHYHASALASKAASTVFPTTYQRVVYFTSDKPNFKITIGKDFAVGQIFPYVIQKDHYGQRVLPESLGNIEYDIRAIDPTSFYNYTWQDMVTNAEYAKTVRGGFASFFFHPFWLEPTLNTPGFADFQKLVEGITALGFQWVAPSSVN